MKELLLEPNLTKKSQEEIMITFLKISKTSFDVHEVLQVLAAEVSVYKAMNGCQLYC